MRRTLGVVTAVTVACASGLAAQQPGGHPGHGSDSAGAMMHSMMQQHAREMDSLDARLDSLTSRMNRSTGNARVEAMAAVINEKPNPHPEAYRGPGKWNAYDIACQGGTISLSVNGKPTAVWENCPLLKGRVGIQAEFAVIEVRAIRFKPQ